MEERRNVWWLMTFDASGVYVASHADPLFWGFVVYRSPGGPNGDFVFIFHFLIFSSPFSFSVEISVFLFLFPFSFLTFWFSLRHLAFRFLFFTFPFPFLTFWFSLLHFAFRLRFLASFARPKKTPVLQANRFQVRPATEVSKTWLWK